MEKTLDYKEQNLVKQFVNEMIKISEKEPSTEGKKAAKKETATPGLLRLLEFGLNFPWRFKNWLPKYDYDVCIEFGEIKEVFETKSNIYTK